MRAVYERFQRDLDGYESYYLDSADPGIVLQNLVTIYVSTNHRPVSISSMFPETTLPDAHRQWRALLRNQQQQLVDFLHVQVDAQSRTMLPEHAELRGAVVKTLELLTARFRAVMDYGEYVRGLLQSCQWSGTSVMLPALAYGRPHYGFASLASSNHVKWLDCLKVPGGGAIGHEPIVNGLLAIDSVRFDSRLISKYEADTRIDGRSPTERPVGEMRKMVKLTSQLVSTYGPYEIQPQLLWSGWHDGFWEWMAALVRARHQQSAEIIRALDDEEKSRAFCMQRQQHDLISAVTSLSRNRRAIGHYGEKPLVTMAKSSGLEQVEKMNVMLSDPGQRDTLAVKLVDQFVSHLMSSQRKMTWGQVMDEQGFISYREFAYALSTIGFSIEWDEQASLLNWKQLSLTAGTVDYFGADFAFTDGEAYSKPIGHCVAGFSPVLALNNRKAYGAEIALTKSWNVSPSDEKKGIGGTIEYSVVTAKGYLEVRTGLAHERHTLPASAWMGEETARPRFLLDTTDEGQQAIKTYYTAQSPEGYVQRMYTPSRGRVNDTNKTFFQRDWDAVATSSADEVARLAMQGLYLAEFGGQVRSASETEYVYSDEGFLQRIPIKSSRNGHLYYASVHGDVYAKLNQRGNVLFSGETSMDITLDQGTSEIEAVVDIHNDRMQAAELGGLKSGSIARIPDQPALGAPLGVVRV